LRARWIPLDPELQFFRLVGKLKRRRPRQPNPFLVDPIYSLVFVALRSALLSSLASLACLGVASTASVPSCSKKSHGGTDAASSATTAAPRATGSAAPAASSAPPRTVTPDLDAALMAYADLESLVASNTVGDSASRCAQIDSARPSLEKRPEPEVHKFLDDAKKVCGYDVPLVDASDALDQLARPGSQASVQLSCNVAARDLEKARAQKTDSTAKLRDVDARFHRLCNR
jgi:hypothetical protein